MRKSTVGLVIVIACLAFFIGCASLLPSIKPLSRMNVEGPTAVAVGGSVTLTAKGYDSDGDPMSVSPAWSITPGSLGDIGEIQITPSVGSTVTAKGVKKGYLDIVIEQGGVKKVKVGFEVK